MTANHAARALALEFTRALTTRDYAHAWSMTAPEYRQRVTQEQMRQEFESFVPPDWGETEPVEGVMGLPDWLDRRPEDVACVHVSISGDVYSEAVAAVVSRQDNGLRIRQVEWGRP